MLVSYLPLLFSALVSPANNVYRSQYLSTRIVIIVGIFLMALPPVYLQDLPLTLRPLLQ